MRGIGYLIVEIVLLLIASGVIGYLVGHFSVTLGGIPS